VLYGFWFLILFNVSETYIRAAGRNFLRTCGNLLEVRLGVRFPTGKQGSYHYQVSCILLLMLFIPLAQSMMLIPDSNPAASLTAHKNNSMVLKEFQQRCLWTPLWWSCYCHNFNYQRVRKWWSCYCWSTLFSLHLVFMAFG